LLLFALNEEQRTVFCTVPHICPPLADVGVLILILLLRMANGELRTRLLLIANGFCFCEWRLANCEWQFTISAFANG
jgi:hypothetical protein